MAAYYALLEPGDTVLGLRLDHGGHLTHGHRVNFSGRNYRFVAYGVAPETERIDFDEVRRLAQEHRPKLIVTGASAYPRVIDFAAFREIADEVGALLMVDMAHFSGLVAAGLHPNPVEWADIVTSTTHKTLRRPALGLRPVPRPTSGRRSTRAVFPGLQGGPLCHATAAKAVCFAVAGTEAFREYQRAGRANADALAEALLEGGHRLVSGGTDTHLVLLNLRGSQWSGKDAEERLHAIGLTVNRNAVPFDERPPAVSSGVRIGTPAATMRGLDADDFREVGRIDLRRAGARRRPAGAAARVDALLARRPLYAGPARLPDLRRRLMGRPGRSRARGLRAPARAAQGHAAARRHHDTRDFRQLSAEIAGHALLRGDARPGARAGRGARRRSRRRPACRCRGKKVGVVPILRAGVGMLDGVLAMIPVARVGFIGLYRNEETLEPVALLPEAARRPRRARGAAARPDARDRRLGGARGRPSARSSGRAGVRLLCIIAAPEGIETLHDRHPDVIIHAACIDRQLNDIGYILPGLGDAGDRLWGTK